MTAEEARLLSKWSSFAEGMAVCLRLIEDAAYQGQREVQVKNLSAEVIEALRDEGYVVEQTKYQYKVADRYWIRW